MSKTSYLLQLDQARQKLLKAARSANGLRALPSIREAITFAQTAVLMIEKTEGITPSTCGEAGLTQETRPCADCAQFRSNPVSITPHWCHKKLMGVTPTMRVGFYPRDGTCFEVKP